MIKGHENGSEAERRRPRVDDYRLDDGQSLAELFDGYVRATGPYVVFAALASVPSALSSGEYGLYLLLLPFTVVLLQVCRIKRSGKSVWSVYGHTLPCFLACVAVFHMVHHSRDVTGLILSVMAWILLVPVFIVFYQISLPPRVGKKEGQGIRQGDAAAITDMES